LKYNQKSKITLIANLKTINVIFPVFIKTIKVNLDVWVYVTNNICNIRIYNIRIYKNDNKKLIKDYINRYIMIDGDNLCNIAKMLKYVDVKNMLLISKDVESNMKKSGIDKIMKERYQDYNYVYNYEPELAIRIRYYAQRLYENNKSKYNKRLLRTTGVLFEFCIDRKKDNIEFLDTHIFTGTQIHKYIWERLITNESQLKMFENITLKNHSNWYVKYVKFFKNLRNRQDYDIKLTPGKNIDLIISNGEIKGETILINEMLNNGDLRKIKRYVVKHNRECNSSAICKLIINLIKNNAKNSKQIYVQVIKNIKNDYEQIRRRLIPYLMKIELKNKLLSKYLDIIQTHNLDFYKVLFKCSDELVISRFSIRFFKCSMVHHSRELKYCLWKIDNDIFYKLMYKSGINLSIEFIKMLADDYKHFPNYKSYSAINYLINNGHMYDFSPDNSHNTSYISGIIL